MLEKIIKIAKQYKEVLTYIFFGGLTTVVNFVVYYFLTRFFNIDPNFSNMIALLISIIFAFFTNKFFVFESNEKSLSFMVPEFFRFFVGRLFSALVDIMFFYIGVSLFMLNDFLVKILINILVIVLNYIISKYFVFRKGE